MTTTKRKGRTNKVKLLQQKKNWEKIVDYTEYMMTREAICKFMDCSKDTFLKALKEQGYKDWNDFKSQVELNMYSNVKRKFFSRLKDDDVSDKLLIFGMEKYVIPNEEFSQEKNDEAVKIVYVPVSDFGNPEDMRKFAEQQQDDLEAEIKDFARENNLD